MATNIGIRAATPGLSRLAQAIGQQGNAYQAGYDAELKSRSALAQAMASARAHDARADVDEAEAAAFRNRPQLIDESIAAGTGTTLPAVRAVQDYIRTGTRPMQALQGPTPDGGNLPDAPLVDDPTQNKIMQALSRAVTLRTNSKDTKPDDWAKAQGMYRDMDLGDAVLRGEMTPAAVGSSQAAVGAKPLVHADSSGLVTNLFSGAQNDPTRVHVVTEKERQLGNQAKAGAAENYAQAKNANASAAKTTKELELLATGGGKGSLTSPKDRFEAENKLRDEYQKQAGTFIKIRDAYNLVQAGAQDPSAAGDLSLIFAYMRILDPNSVVREGEFATAQNATGVPDRLRNIYNRALNGERLSKEQRADFVGRAKKIYDTTAASQAGVDKTYNDLAGRYGLDVNNIVTSYQVPQAPQPQPAQPGVAPKGLTAEEQAELDALRKRFGKTKP